MNKIVDIVLMVILLIYIISPLDFIPDSIPVVGWIDDGVALAIFMYLLSDVGGGGKKLQKEVKL